MYKLPTTKELLSKYSDNISLAVETETKIIQEQIGVPDRPKKPSQLERNHTSAQAMTYAKLLELYEAEMANYCIQADIFDRQYTQLQGVLMKYAEELSNLKSVPEQYRSKVREFAWNEGHAHGFSEYKYWLDRLAEIFM